MEKSLGVRIPSPALFHSAHKSRCLHLLFPRLSACSFRLSTRRKLISEVIDSVRKSFSEVGIASYEIIVCDNNSTDATAERAAAKGAKVVTKATTRFRGLVTRRRLMRSASG